MNIFGIGGKPIDISFTLNGSDSRELKQVKTMDGIKSMLVYRDGEDVSGEVHVKLKKSGTRVEHQGIRIEFIGVIELISDRITTHEFAALSKLIAFPGEISQSTSYNFNFQEVEMPCESYNGNTVKLRYFVRLTVIRRFTNITADEDIFVQKFNPSTESESLPVVMEVGIEDALHIEFEFAKSRFHLRDVIIGKIYFTLVRIKIKYSEINITRKETVGNGYSDNEVVGKFEILDGAPAKGESVPIRIFLAAYDLSPTMQNIQNRFSVQYFMNIVLVDEDDRRYFKQQELTLWRKSESEFLLAKEHLYRVPKSLPEPKQANGKSKADDMRSVSSREILANVS